MSIEDPEVDRFEQLLDAGYDDPEDVEYPEELPLDADPLDVADQHRSVPLDDDLEG
jgi:hypothetical protein